MLTFLRCSGLAYKIEQSSQVNICFLKVAKLAYKANFHTIFIYTEVIQIHLLSNIYCNNICRRNDNTLLFLTHVAIVGNNC